MASTDVTVQFYPLVWEGLNRGPDVRQWLGDVVDGVALDLRESAPVRSGAGRASIRSWVELGVDGWEGKASWDDAHYYMGIQNSRSRWAESTVQRIRYV